jgi:Acyl-CoA dehydrogenase, N-terminal domain
MTRTAQDVLAAVRRLADDVLFPDAMRVDRLDMLPAAHLDALAAQGLYGAAAPPDAGGLGLDLTTACGVTEELAGGCLSCRSSRVAGITSRLYRLQRMKGKLSGTGRGACTTVSFGRMILIFFPNGPWCLPAKPCAHHGLALPCAARRIWRTWVQDPARARALAAAVPPRLYTWPVTGWRISVAAGMPGTPPHMWPAPG